MKIVIEVFLAALVAIGPAGASGQSQVDEYRLKAAFLFHFAQFVNWPPTGAVNADRSLLFCVLGEDPFHGDLEGTVQGKVVGGKRVQIRHIKQVQDGKECQLVFIDRNEAKRVHELVATLNGLPVLTVGESEDFLRQGGIIRFCMEDRKVRFEVNQDAADKAHLNISSRLLLLAKTVVGRGGG